MQKLNKTIVIKIGTKVIASSGKTLDPSAKAQGQSRANKVRRGIDKDRLKAIVGQVADLLDRGLSVIIVTSGAIGAGMGLLGLKKRPVKLQELQTTASIGQSSLMQQYSHYFKERGYLVGQILLTQEDFNDRVRYLNIKYTLQTLLSHKAVPVINENDTVSTEEIKCGDNDRLSNLVSDLCHADILILLSDVDGLLDEKGNVIDFVDDIDSKVLKLAKSSECELGTGGMCSKLEAIRAATASGIECVLANGKAKNVIMDIVDGKKIGTRFGSSGAKLIARKRWIAFSSKPKGAIIVDSGAKTALLDKNKSLLASGIVEIDGNFVSGDVIKVVDKNFVEFARGLTNYSSSELLKIKGLKTSQIKDALGERREDEVIHKDNLVIL